MSKTNINKYSIVKHNNHNEIFGSFSFSILIILIVICSGCLFGIGSDWEYEYYYYVNIKNNSSNNYSVTVPISPDFISAPLPITHEYSVINLSIEKGDCKLKVITYNSQFYLKINGTSSISISASDVVWDGPGIVTLKKEENDKTVLIYSNSSNVSLVVDSRCVKKTNEKKSWDLRYSVVINPSMDFPIPSKTTWKNHLSEEYYIHLKQGWKPYLVKEEIDWFGVPIK